MAGVLDAILPSCLDYDDVEETHVRVKVIPEPLEPTVVTPLPSVGASLRAFGYEFDPADEPKLAHFLIDRFDIAGWLPAIGVALTMYFGPAPRGLELLDDPESVDGAQTLYIVVKVQGDADEAMKKLNRFDDEWWIEHSIPSLCITAGPA